MTGITSLGQALWESYDSLPETKRKECVKAIAKSSDRLISLMNNILDLSALTSLKIELNLQNIDVSSLVQDSIKKCKKLYLEEKKLQFDIQIEDGLYTKCDKHYIGTTIDNLIINAISYSNPDGTIHITLNKKDGKIEFAIRDAGVGIPQNELFDIFRPFTVSSRTHTPAGGRGVGLALCYDAIAAHKRKIWAESDGKSWAEFKFLI
jgi:signal transduction histidine kinase